MIRQLSIFGMLFGCIVLNAQIVINELDSDTPGVDDKEFVELKSDEPYFPLDGYVLVFFNGNQSSSTANLSYFTVNLSGLITDANGLVVIGSALVSPVPQLIISNNVIQNGEDAVAIYLGNPYDFPKNTLATTENLIDAMIYDNGQANATGLMNLLDIYVQTNENMHGQGTQHSIQRKPDGSYEVKMPTPGANNDGGGFQYNGVTIVVDSSHKNEGDSFDITFMTQNPVEDDLLFSFSLNNETFDEDDFIGSTSVFIPSGQNYYTTTINIIDDEFDEGDEVLRISFGSLPFGYIRMNDNIYIRIIDNDFSVSTWGTPLNPTFGIVESTQPEEYYDSLIGKAGDELKQALQDIIANPDVVRSHSYGDVTIILNEADQNPENNNQVWMMYVESPRAKLDFQASSSNVGSWNREHIYPQSRGGFSNATSGNIDGKDIWLPTNADDLAAGHSDAHHIRAEDGPENSSRNNKDYGLDAYNGPSGTQGSWKGDVARAIFYMAVRYNQLEVVNGNPPDNSIYQLGDLATLLQWNLQDMPDDFEMNRNNIIYEWQINRNPFIDLPELANYIWGINSGEVWQGTMSAELPDFDYISVYPNPAKDILYINGITEDTTLELYDVKGSLLMKETSTTSPVSLKLIQPTGLYFLRLVSDSGVVVKKIYVK